jgi:hypothetical protein
VRQTCTRATGFSAKTNACPSHRDGGQTMVINSTPPTWATRGRQDTPASATHLRGAQLAIESDTPAARQSMDLLALLSTMRDVARGFSSMSRSLCPRWLRRRGAVRHPGPPCDKLRLGARTRDELHPFHHVRSQLHASSTAYDLRADVMLTLTHTSARSSPSPAPPLVT